MKKSLIRYIAIAAVTLDGKIAAHQKHFTDWTSKEDKEFMRSLLDKSDVVAVGRNTYESAKKPLSKRNCLVLTRSIVAISQKKQNLAFINPQKTNIANYIKECGYKTVALLGGTQTYTYFLEHGLIDELYLTIEPIIFGKGLPLFEGKFMKRTPRIVSVKKLNKNGTVLIHAKFDN